MLKVATKWELTFSETLWGLLFVFYIASVWCSGMFLCSKYPQIGHFFETHLFLTILFGIVFLLGVPVLFALLILELKDRKKSRCPKCKTRFKYGDMELGPDKIITTFQCQKCGYTTKISERFVYKKFKREFSPGNFTSEEMKEYEELSKQYDNNLKDIE